MNTEPRPDREYERILTQALGLDLTTQRRLVTELTARWGQEQTDLGPKRNIMDLQGLGKEIWRDMDAQEYVSKERASWSERG